MFSLSATAFTAGQVRMVTCWPTVARQFCLVRGKSGTEVRLAASDRKDIVFVSRDKSPGRRHSPSDGAENAHVAWRGFITQRVMATFARTVVIMASYGFFGTFQVRLDGQECPSGVFRTTRLSRLTPELQRIGPTRGRIGCILDSCNANRTAMSL